MSESQRKDVWSGGDTYEPYVGRWSRRVAREFLSRFDVSPDRSWLDVGCGTGALSQAILEKASPKEVRGIDSSEGYLAYVREQVKDRRAHFDLGDATQLPYESASFDAAVSGLVINFVPRPEAMAAEMARVARRGAAVGVYVWDYAGQMQLMRHFWDAAVALDPSASGLDEGRRFPICQPAPLERLFRDAGLKNVEVRAIDVPTVFRDFDDYWTPFLGGQGPAPGYAVSLSDERRAVLRERIRSALPVSGDGSIHLTARAWAVCGNV